MDRPDVNDGSLARDGDGRPTDAFGLSPAQFGMWFAQQLDPDAPLNIAQYVDLRGDLDIDLLDRVSDEAAREHGSGFVRLFDDGTALYQVVDLAQDAPLTVVDMRDEPDPVTAALDWMRSEYSSPLDLLRDRLMRAAILRVADDRWFWYTRCHHVVLDGLGATNGMNRVAELYTAAADGREVPPAKAGSLRALYDSEIAYRNSSRFQSDREYWAEKVEGLEQGTNLAPRTAPHSALNHTLTASLSPERLALFDAIVERTESSQATVIIAAFAAYLAKLTDSDEVIVSLPVTGRTTATMRRSGGMVSNVVPLRMHVGGDTTVADLVRSATLAVSGALRHQRYRHEDIRRDTPADVKSRAFFGPAVNIMLFDREVDFGTAHGALNVLSTGGVEDLAVNFYASDAGTRVHVDFESNPNVFSFEETRVHHERFLEFFERFCAAAADTAVLDLDVATAVEHDLSVRQWNATAHDVPAATVTDLLTRQAARTPTNVAVRYADPAVTPADSPALSYAELDARANRLARHLIDLGVAPESCVGLGMRRSLDLVVGMQAVLRSGAAYVPVDPDHPADRTAYILSVVHPVCVLATTRDDLELPPDAVRVDIDTLDLSAHASTPLTDNDRRTPLRPDHAAYVLFTSGSTGRPKGVTVSHRSFVNHLSYMLDEYGYDASDVVLQKTATTFDISAWAFYLPLLVGAQMVLATPDGHGDTHYVATTIADYGITVTEFVPSMLEVFVAEVSPHTVAHAADGAVRG